MCLPACLPSSPWLHHAAAAADNTTCSEYHDRLRGHVIRPLHQWSEALGVVEVRGSGRGCSACILAKGNAPAAVLVLVFSLRSCVFAELLGTARPQLQCLEKPGTYEVGQPFQALKWGPDSCNRQHTLAGQYDVHNSQ